MTTISSTDRRARLRESVTPFLSFFEGPFSRLNLEPGVANFAVGNPLVEAGIPRFAAAMAEARAAG